VSVLREILKRLLSNSMIRRINIVRLSVNRRRNRRKTAAAVFDRIYETGAWGGSREHPNSGLGSRGQVVEKFVSQISGFIASKNAKSIVDIGCGDFHVAQKLLAVAGEDVKYVGIDVSSVVIDHNRKLYSGQNVNFLCGDASEMSLPTADVCLIRQVLQHLSNAQIMKICERCAKYKYVIVTEHYPPEDRSFRANLDKPHGADTRLIDNSAVILDKPPFNLKNVRTLFEVPAKMGDPSWGRLVTVVVEKDALGGSMSN
jgi:SAM-dependent methyltransferase